MNFHLLDQHIEDRYISVQKHPVADLWIYNYTQKTQFERVWTPETIACRGLIMDASRHVIARPFTKFFNYGEQDVTLPNEPFEVFDKMDGSLGILYWVDNTPYIATRGSFNSEQAHVATAILHEQYAHTFDRLNREQTYLFEILYPENRIVVDYGGRKDLVLLAVINTEDGTDAPLPHDLGFPVVKRYDGLNDISTLRELSFENSEGFVIKYRSGWRVKVKFEEYVRLHRILTGVSNIAVWEYLSQNKPFDELLERVPDEFYNWLKQTAEQLTQAYQRIEAICKAEFKILETRKETALYFQTCQHQGVLFFMLDGKDYSQIIWKMVRPVFSKPFKNDTEG